jgi:rSAM/selenodomain-associated transferase 2
MRITVVIPALNEAAEIAAAVAAVRDEVDEVIVVDGGSCDGTTDVARTAGARVRVAAGSNRAAALNTGAALASGDVIYFVHADCRPPAGFADDIRAALDTASSGCFRMRFDSKHWLLGLSGWLTRVDINLFRFGDQSLFTHRDVFRLAFGYDERLTVLEDQDLVRRLRRHAEFVIVPRPVISSARRYRRCGVYRMQLFVYPIVVALYRLGVPQPLLVRIYHRLLDRRNVRPAGGRRGRRKARRIRARRLAPSVRPTRRAWRRRRRGRRYASP